MTAIAISLLFGFAAFVALATVAWAITRGMARGQEIMDELARLDNVTGRRARLSVSSRPAAIARLRQQPFAAA